MGKMLTKHVQLKRSGKYDRTIEQRITCKTQDGPVHAELGRATLVIGMNLVLLRNIRLIQHVIY